MSAMETRTGAEPDGFEMGGLEGALTQAMRRVEAPEGFAARVMERAAAPAVATKKVVVMRSRFVTLSGRAWVGVAIAAMLVLGSFGVEEMHVRRERAQAALATQQFEAAMRIEDDALHHTREQLRRAGVSLQ